MKRLLQCEELDALALGSCVLGSGGGGDPKPELLRTKEILMSHQPPEIIDIADLLDDDFVVPIGFMGAPMVSIEKLPSGKECLCLLEMIANHYGKKPTAICAVEIGGSNAFVPLALGAVTGLPVVDADMIGRAFPELHMSSCALAGISCTPAFLADAVGNRAVVQPASPSRVEPLCRALTEAMGSSVAVALYLLTGKEARKTLCPGTFSQALTIGKEIQEGTFSPYLIGSGHISDIQQDIQGGFLKGKVQITGREGVCEVEFQNEYLVARNANKVLAATPDIIAIIEKESGQPMPVERLKFGLGVNLVALPSPPIWQTAAGLAVVGPRAFGYNFDYVRISA